jgi:predicted deacetylase
VKIANRILIFVVALILTLFFIRFFSHSELDDVTPGIPCEKSLIEMSDVLWIIPLYNNQSILEDKQWIEYLKSKNKTLGLHGVKHTYEEFGEDRSQEYLNTGIKIFEESFFEKPAIFKAPQLKINSFNRKLVEDNKMDIQGEWNQLTHKVYHCSDTGLFPNWMIRIF